MFRIQRKEIILGNGEVKHGRANLLQSPVAVLSDDLCTTEAVLRVGGIAARDEHGGVVNFDMDCLFRGFGKWEKAGCHPVP